MRKLLALAALTIGLSGSPVMGAPLLPATTVQSGSLTPTVVSLGWGLFGIGTRQYQIFRNGQMVSTSPVVGQSYVDDNLVPGTTYVYDVYADNGRNVLTWGGRTTVTTLPLGPVLMVTTFEQDALSGDANIGGWRKFAAEPNKIAPSTNQARAGIKSVRFQFDKATWTTEDCCNRSQILQLAEIKQGAVLGQVQWIGLSTFLETFPQDHLDNSSLIWQFHGDNDGPGRFGPPLSLNQIEANQTVWKTNDPATVFACSTHADPHPTNTAMFASPLVSDIGVWVDWVIKVNFEYVAGSIDIWRNGVHVVSYTGSTIYHCDDQTNENGPYFDFGPYKWNWGDHPSLLTSIVMYVDEVRIGSSAATCNDVKPTGAAACAP